MMWSANLGGLISGTYQTLGEHTGWLLGVRP